MAEDKIGNTIEWDHPAACKAQIVDADRALIDWRGRTKLAIVGFASSSKDKAPFGDPEWVIWGLNQLYRHIPRADAWIDIHHDYAAEAKVVEGTDFLGWLRTAPIPVFMCQRNADIPTSVRYPLEEIVGKYGVDYFTSTISYMIAYGIYAGFRTIGLWGVDLIVGKEWAYQKPCAEFWLGMANASGVHVVVADESALLKTTHRYGYQEGPAEGLVKIAEMEARVRKLDEEKDRLIKTLQTVDGARQDALYWLEMMTLRPGAGTSRRCEEAQVLVVCTSAAETDLTDLAAVQEILGAPTSDEPYLARLITRASRWAETYVGQPLLAQTYFESLDGRGTKRLLLARTPVRSVTKVILGSSSTGDGTVLDSTGYRLEDAEAGILWRDDGFLWQPREVSAISRGIEPGSDTKNYWVEYQAGYVFPGTSDVPRTLPEEIEMAVIAKVSQLYHGDADVVSERLGDYAVTYRSEGPDEPSGLLDPYRRV